MSPPDPVAPPTPYRLPDPAVEQAFAQRIGAHIHDPLLLRQALTHRSVLHDWVQLPSVNAAMQSNERLEFLGDAALGLITAERLYTGDAEANEGELTRTRVALVRAETLVYWARQIGLPDALYLGTGETISTKARDRILAGAMEAIIGAIYIDQGQQAAADFVNGFLDREEARILADESISNPKGRLQELVQEHRQDQPIYETIDEEGPDHARVFTVQVTVNDRIVGHGIGRTKREAQQIAARAAIESIEQDQTILATGEV